MGIKTKSALAAFFETNDKPTQAQFADLIDTMVAIPTAGATGVIVVESTASATSRAVGAFGAVMLSTAATASALSQMGLTTVGAFGAVIVAAGTTASAQGHIGLGSTGGIIATGDIADLAVTTAKIAADAVTVAKLAGGTLTDGFSATPYNAGTKSSGTYTPDEANGNLQYAVNGGAHTLAPPTNNCTIIVQYTNNASAGAITTSGFNKVTGAFTTTDGDDFFAYIAKHNGFSHLNIVALQ